MSEATAAEALIARIREGTAPDPLRSAAARGALPFARVELAQVFVLLLEDADPGIRAEARTSLESLPDNAVREILSDPGCAPEVLVFYARNSNNVESVAELITFHRAVPNEAMEHLAAHGNSAVIELVLTNQELLFRHAPLLDRLAANPALRADQRGRILELLDRVAHFQSRSAAKDEESPAVSEDDDLDLAEAARQLNVDVGELFAASEIMGGEEFEQSDVPEVRDAYRKVLTLNTGQRAILAMKGGREERMILVRDTNKLVALSVLKNGRITDGEIEHISTMRNVSQEVLRAVGSNREWVKSYSVVNALVHNPLTPPGLATRFVSRLNDRDLKMLTKDKNVSELMRRMAQKAMETRLQRTKSAIRKKH